MLPKWKQYFLFKNKRWSSTAHVKYSDTNLLISSLPVSANLCVTSCHFLFSFFYFHFLFLFLGLLDLLHLAGLIHHFAVNHRLGHHLHNFPGPNVRLFCTDRDEKKMRLNEMGWEGMRWEMRKMERDQDKTRKDEFKWDHLRFTLVR